MGAIWSRLVSDVRESDAAVLVPLKTARKNTHADDSVEYVTAKAA
jgi:hypothetical protein